MQTVLLSLNYALQKLSEQPLQKLIRLKIKRLYQLIVIRFLILQILLLNDEQNMHLKKAIQILIIVLPDRRPINNLFG